MGGDFYGWMGVGGGIFWVAGGRQTFFTGGWGYILGRWGWSLVLV